MFDNDNPKIIVDDDFLDLRNDQSKSPRMRPPSARSGRGSSSVNTQGQVSTVRDNLPGLKRILNNYNQKNQNPFHNRRSSKADIQPVDCRFRRKVEKKGLSSRSESVLQENETTRKDTSASSDISTRNQSSESEKQETIPVKSSTSKLVAKWDEHVENRRDKERSKTKKKAVSNKIIDKEKKEKGEKVIVKKELKLTPIEPVKEKDDVVPKKSAVKKNDIKADLNEVKFIDSIEKRMNWFNPPLESRYGFCSFPIFKKSWTVPSIPLIKKNFSWTRHHNVLCAKVDRKTYEFDTDDTVSDSEDRLSAYSSIARSNYMNLIFCLGCLCGIFLIGGILTASEIQADYFRPPDSEEGMITFFYKLISHTFHVVFSVLYQILTLPTTTLFRTEQPKHWSIYDKFLYFVHE